MKCNFEKFSNLHKCNFTFSLQMMMIWGSHNTKQTFFLRIPNTFANHYPSSFFSFYLKEHYYTVHGIGEAKEKMGQNLWGEEEEAVTRALKIHNLWVGQRGWSLPKNWVKRGQTSHVLKDKLLLARRSSTTCFFFHVRRTKINWLSRI